jgi:hypothetical protein
MLADEDDNRYLVGGQFFEVIFQTNWIADG